MKRHLTSLISLIALALPASAQNRPVSPKSDAIQREWKDADGITVPAQIFLPPHYDKAKKYPLVLCLHGAGEMKSAPFTAKTAASTKLLEPAMRERFPAIILVPQTANGCVKRPERGLNNGGVVVAGAQPEGPALTLVLRALADVQKEYSVDAARIYVSGQSMGGVATWHLIEHHPEIFAAAVPICGVGDVKLAAKIQCPVWCFHGDADKTVPVQCSRDMVEAMKTAKLPVKYTELPGIGHGSWGPAWNAPELAPWLFAQKKSAVK